MKKSELGILKKSVLFSKLDDVTFASLMQFLPGSPEEFTPGTVIYSPENYRRSLGIMLKGTAVVSKPNGMLMSFLSSGDVFGIPLLFSDQSFPTVITAKENCRVYFIEKEAFLEMMSSCRQLNEIFLGILSNRIMFLNERIERISAHTPAAKVKGYLESTASRLDSRSFTIPVSLSGLASGLSLGRTSLYRAFDELEEEGFLRKDGKNITLLR